MNKLFISIIFSIFYLNVFSQNVIVKGNAKSYAGDTIEIYTYQDYIIKNKKILAKSYVKENGNFNFKFNTEETIQTFIELNVFKGILFVEAGNNYEIILPKKTLKDKEDELNPYFRPIEFYVNEIHPDKKSINNLIFSFDTIYNKIYNETLAYIQEKKSFNLEKQIKFIEKNAPDTENDFFNNYKKYKIVSLRYLVYNTKIEKFITENFAYKPILYTNPAYNEAIEIALSDFLINTAGDSLLLLSSEKNNWQKFNKTTAKTYSFFLDKNLREYLILNNLHSAFYKYKASQMEIILLLNSCNTESDIKIHKEIAENFINNAGNLIIGKQIPDFKLKDKNENTFLLKNFKGKFIYLSFCNEESYSCQKDLETLNILYLKKIDKLEIVTILIDKNIEDMKEFISEKNYNWTFLYCPENSKLIDEYKIVSFPTYFLINPEGKLLIMPAPGPSENFEPAYFQQYQTWNRNQLRNSKTNNKSIIPN